MKPSGPYLEEQPELIDETTGEVLDQVKLCDVLVPSNFKPIGERGIQPWSSCSQFQRRKRVSWSTEQPSRTKSAFAADVNINRIVKKYLSTGQLPQMVGEPRFGDFSSGTTFQESMCAVKRAQEAFDALPVNVRVAMGHDPGRLLDLVHSNKPEDREQAYTLGLLQRPKADPPGGPAASPPGAPSSTPGSAAGSAAAPA